MMWNDHQTVGYWILVFIIVGLPLYCSFIKSQISNIWLVCVHTYAIKEYKHVQTHVCACTHLRVRSLDTIYTNFGCPCSNSAGTFPSFSEEASFGGSWFPSCLVFWGFWVGKPIKQSIREAPVSHLWHVQRSAQLQLGPEKPSTIFRYPSDQGKEQTDGLQLPASMVNIWRHHDENLSCDALRLVNFMIVEGHHLCCL